MRRFLSHLATLLTILIIFSCSVDGQLAEVRHMTAGLFGGLSEIVYSADGERLSVTNTTSVSRAVSAMDADDEADYDTDISGEDIMSLAATTVDRTEYRGGLRSIRTTSPICCCSAAAMSPLTAVSPSITTRRTTSATTARLSTARRGQ